MAADIRAIADEVFATIGTGHQIAPFTETTRWLVAW
jgi:hypothetical protein